MNPRKMGEIRSNMWLETRFYARLADLFRSGFGATLIEQEGVAHTAVHEQGMANTSRCKYCIHADERGYNE